MIAAVPWKPGQGRVCAVCGKRKSGPRGHTYGYHTILARNGIKGDKAHPECVAKLAKAVQS